MDQNIESLVTVIVVVILYFFVFFFGFWTRGVTDPGLGQKPCISTAADINKEELIKWMNDNHIE